MALVRALGLISLRVVAALLALGCSDGGNARDDATAAEPVDAPDELGSHAVGHRMLTLTDVARNERSMVVNVWYPARAEDVMGLETSDYPLQDPFTLPSEVAVDDVPVAPDDSWPLLVFSHGFGGINTQSTQLMEALASHGFVVAAPEHTGNTALDTSDESPASKRVPDVSFVIDELLARAAGNSDALAGRIDESKIGVLGHSFGGATALGSVAGWAGANADPRVGAIGVIAGSVGEANFSRETLEAVTQPTALLVGTFDTGALDHHRYAFEHLTRAEGLVHIEVQEANHTHFANVCAIGNKLLEIGISQDAWAGLGAEALIDPYNDTCTDEVFPISEAHRLQNLYMVAHFKRYLLGQRGYAEHLSSAYAEAHEPSIVLQAR